LVAWLLVGWFVGVVVVSHQVYGSFCDWLFGLKIGCLVVWLIGGWLVVWLIGDWLAV